MDIWTDCQEIQHRFAQLSLPAVNIASKQVGFEADTWQEWLIPALNLYPETLTTTKLRIRFPYTSAVYFSQLLSENSKLGFLSESETGYLLTDKGLHAALTLWKTYITALEKHPFSSHDSLKAAAHGLDALVQNALSVSDPHSKWCLQHNRSTAYSPHSSLICQIHQSLSDLDAWRDDCHLGAWQPYHYLHGYVWEVFTVLWHGEANTIEEITEKLSASRGVSRAEYITAIEELEMRGWLNMDRQNHYTLTRSGMMTRQAAEDYTDEMFFQPFRLLPEADRNTLSAALHTLLEELMATSS